MKTTRIDAAIFNALPPERRTAILHEAAQASLRALLSNGTTFGDLVASLPKSPIWAEARKVKVSEVLSPENQEKRAPFSTGKKLETTKKPTKWKSTGKVSAIALTRVLAFVKAHPGERTETIRAALPWMASVIKPALHKLKAQGKVKTSGKRRATTYRAVK